MLRWWKRLWKREPKRDATLDGILSQQERIDAHLRAEGKKPVFSKNDFGPAFGKPEKYGY